MCFNYRESVFVYREIEKSTPGSLREFSNSLHFEGNISKLTDINSQTFK